MKKRLLIILSALIYHIPVVFGHISFVEPEDSLARHVEVYSMAPFCSSYMRNIDEIDYWEVKKISEKNKLKVGGKEIRLLSWYLKPVKDFIAFYGEPDKTSALYYIYKLHEYWCFPSVFSKLSDMEIPIKMYYWEDKELTVFCVPDNHWLRYPDSLSGMYSKSVVKDFEDWLACDSGDDQWRIILWKKGVFDLKQYISHILVPYSNPFYEYSNDLYGQNVEGCDINPYIDCPEVFKTFTYSDFFKFYSALPIVWFGNQLDRCCLNELYGMGYADFVSRFGNPVYNETYLYLPGDSRFALPRVTWPVDELLSNYRFKIIPLRISRYYNQNGYMDFWFIRNEEDFTYNVKFADNIDIVNYIYSNSSNSHKDYLQWLAGSSDDNGWSLIYADMSFYDNPFYDLYVGI